MKKLILTLSLCVGLAACHDIDQDTIDEDTTVTSSPEASDPIEQPTASTPAPLPERGRTDADDLLDALDATIAHQEQMLESSPSDWLRHARIARAQMTRARLTGSWDDWDNARDAVTRGFEAAGDGAGPRAERVALNMSLHHFDEVEVDLQKMAARPLLPLAERANIASRTAELAMQRGDLPTALAKYQEAHELEPSGATHVALANYHFKTGNLDLARRALDDAIQGQETPEPFVLSWIILHRGIIELDSGNYDAARQHFEHANATFSGWYLIEEHLAEVLAIQGEEQRALTMYRSIVDRVRLGEFMEALADAYEANGYTDLAAQWRHDAGAQYLADMRRYPQAVYGHGMDYFLTGPDAAKALEIASANHALRPGPDAKIKLAQAQVRADRLANAKQTIDAALSTGWKTADLHATAYVIYTLSGDAQEATRHASIATSLHPEAIEDISWLEPARN